MFRGYDAALGRFNQVDPLAEASGSFSPYSYGFNNPVFFNDPNGDYPEDDGSVYRYVQPRYPWDVVYGAPTHRMGPGSGNYWSDGIQYSDWSPTHGSATYRAWLAAGMEDIGGTLYHIGSDGSRSEWVEENVWSQVCGSARSARRYRQLVVKFGHRDSIDRWMGLLVWR